VVEMIAPTVMLGSIFGVLINSLLPELITKLFFTCMMAYMGLGVIKKAI